MTDSLAALGKDHAIDTRALSYRFKLLPRGKQFDVITQSWARPVAALLCRPGTGKSKLIIDTAGLQWLAGMIEALIIVAPDGVHTQWVLEAIPTHMSDDVPWVGGYYSATETRKTAFADLQARLFSRDARPLRVLSVTFDGLQTPRGRKLAHELAVRYRTLVAIDESHRVSNQKAKGYKAARELMTFAKTKRIATGTLLRQNPFSAYGQFELLGKELLGFASLTAFKSMYSKLLDAKSGLYRHIATKFKQKTGRDYKLTIVEKDEDGKPTYRNMADLRRRLEKWSYFLTLADVSGKEPIVNQSVRYVELSAQQQTIYDNLVKYGIADAPKGVLIADGALALATRLAQVVGGFVPSEDDPLARPIAGDNHRLTTLLDLCEDSSPDKMIIWAKYKAELRAIALALDAVDPGSVAEYHGDVSERARRDNKTRFIADPKCRFFVGQQQAGGTGLDGMQGVASQMVFYSNTYSFLEREQCIARLARTEGADVVNVVDLMCADTVDEDIVRCVQAARDVTEAVLLKRLNRTTGERK